MMPKHKEGPSVMSSRCLLTALLLLGATFQAQDRTLREEELQGFQAQMVEAVGKAGARLRV